MSRWKRTESELESLERDALDVDPKELDEFLAGDLFPSRASSEFKERLRARLWEEVVQKYGPNARKRRDDA